MVLGYTRNEVEQASVRGSFAQMKSMSLCVKQTEFQF